MTTAQERAVVFPCDAEKLIGIVHIPPVASDCGVLIVVGGPQYRVGSHRQFVLLARYLAANDVPVMRFDCRGMGDAEGEISTYEDFAVDIRAAIDAFFVNYPHLESVILWGLCDAASAAMFYGHSDSRVKGMILLNPWVRTEAGQAQAYLRHYYINRLLDKAFWKKTLSGKLDLKKSTSSLWDLVNKARPHKEQAAPDAPGENTAPIIMPLRKRMYDGLAQFTGWVGIIISGDDLTAAEFEDMVKGSKAWKKLLRKKAVEFHYLPEANHTFSKQVWRDEVAGCTLAWVRRELQCQK